MKSVEDNLFALGFIENSSGIDTNRPQVHAALTRAAGFRSDGKQFQLISLYEQRLKRGLKNDTAALRELQAERNAQAFGQTAQLPAPPKRALAAAVGQVSNVPTTMPDVTTRGENGFVFSNSEILTPTAQSLALTATAKTETPQPEPATAPAPLTPPAVPAPNGSVFSNFETQPGHVSNLPT